MANPFNFDPFASAPAAPPAAAPAPSSSAGNGIAASNPFDNFGFVQPASTTATPSGQANNAPSDWQQSARAAMATGNGVWKNVAASSAKVLPLATSTSSLHSSSSSLTQTKKGARRIIPYVSPISTLETNWDPWLFAAQSSSPASLWGNGGNNCTYLLVRANEGCCLAGGVEGVLKWSRQRSDRPVGAGGMGVEAELGGLDSQLNLSESQEDNGASNIGYGSVHSSINSDSGGKPKALGSGSGGVGGSMRFLKSGLKKAQQSIERSVTTMAIKADGGKNPDQLCVALHYCGGLNSQAVNVNMGHALGFGKDGVVGQGVARDVGNVCLSRTEWVALPSNISGEEEGDGVLFSIPLCVPDLSFLEAASDTNGAGVQLTVRLYIRSGAALLKAVANAGLKREYCVGESALLYSNLMQLMNGGQRQQPSAGAKNCGTINVPFTSGMLAETSSFSRSSSFSSTGSGDAPAALHIIATPRVKFGPVCTQGWSLTDPVTTPPAGPTSWLKMFNLPLDQGYAFSMLRTHLHHHQLLTSQPTGQYPVQEMSQSSSVVLLANEKAVESAVVLPLATACVRLFSAAAAQSKILAENAAVKTRRKETVYLHPQDEPRNNAVVEAALLDGCADVELGVVALVMLGDAPEVDVNLGFGCGVGLETGSVPSVKASLSFQPPHTIFEESLGVGSCPLLDEQSGAVYINGSIQPLGGPNEAISARFCPRILTGLDDLLPGLAGTKPNGRYVGSIRLEVQVGYANSAVDTISSGISGSTSVEGLIELESYLDDARMGQGGGKVPVLAPAIDGNTGKRLGTFVLCLRVQSNGNRSPTNRSVSSGSLDEESSASSGLVSVVGLDTLTEELGLAPYLDCNAPPPNSQLVASPPTPRGMRRRQIATMGSFVSSRFLTQQASIREKDAGTLSDRFVKYQQSIAPVDSAEADDDEEVGLPLFERRSPKPFRPSASRGDALLSGIGFNVHVQSLSLNVLQDGIAPIQAAATQSVTHGAPADHAAGFGGSAESGKGGIGDNDSAPKGGLRRLEGKRMEFAKELDDSVAGLITAVGDHFKSRVSASAARQQAGVKPCRHIPPNLRAVFHYRTKAMECAQRLHGLNWEVAVRRANCFSQALGIAVTSYLASLSDGGPAWRGYAGIWARHGYLVTCEGLLSAVGKELGMIEDASISIAMLRMVSVVLVPDDGSSNTSPTDNTRQRIPVPHSPYIRWVHLIYVTPNGSHSKTQYRLEIGLDPSYYQSRVPGPLKNGAAVRFFPVLFQMGVDIRQWGANAGRNVTSQIKDKSKVGGMADPSEDSTAEAADDVNGGSLLDDGDEDDEVGVADSEILMKLNVEGCRKLNAYAHSANPVAAGATWGSAPPPVFHVVEQQQSQPLPIHPSLVPLSEAVKASAGKMEHSVLDRAATACQRLGGGGTVFCKSGKDRTAMQVTFKQAQFLERFTKKEEGGTALEDTTISYSDVFSKSSLMRKHGVRIPICEKNAGEPKLAFNPLQRKFMPEMLRPEAALCTWSKPET